jgi:hypothetical protein
MQVNPERTSIILTLLNTTLTITIAAPSVLNCEDKLARTESWEADRDAAAAEREEVSAAWREDSDAEREELREEKDAEKDEIAGPENCPLMQQTLSKQSRPLCAIAALGRMARRRVVNFIFVLVVLECEMLGE